MNRNTVIIAVVAVIVVAGAVVAYRAFSGPPGQTYTSGCAYAECGWLGQITVKHRPGEPYPPVCPKCGKNSVLPLARCKQCGQRQHLNEELRNWIPELKDLEPRTLCRNCGNVIRHGD